MFHGESPLSTCTCYFSFVFGADVESGGGGVWVRHCMHWSSFRLSGAIVLRTWSTTWQGGDWFSDESWVCAYCAPCL